MAPKSSSISTRLAASRATSVPRRPMAMPMCAAFSAGASFTPSPVMATTSPPAFRACTSLSFCCGITRAKTLVRSARSRSAASSIASMSAPVSTPPVVSMPASAAMASAVPGWSPVTMATRTPARRHSATAAGTSGRSGSARATRPRGWNSKPWGVAGQGAPGLALWAVWAVRPFWAVCVVCAFCAVTTARVTASTRLPLEVNCRAASCQTAACASLRRHSSAIASGAPLAAMVGDSCPGACHTCDIASSSGVRPQACTSSQPSWPWAGSRCSWPRAWKARSIGSKGSGWLASTAASSSAWKASGSGAAGPAPPAVHTRRAGGSAAAGSPAAGFSRFATGRPITARSVTAMRFQVSVPVLSVHSTVAAPSVSMAAGRRASTRSCDRRHAPMAMNTVRMSENSSGSSDMASVTPPSKAASQSPLVSPKARMNSRLAAAPAMAARRTSRRVCSVRGVSGVSMLPSACPMRPMALAAPVAVTCAMPWPLTTTEPAQTKGCPSPPGWARAVPDAASDAAPGLAGSTAPSCFAALRTGTDSPVSSDSSVSRAWAESSTPSAATRSPSPISSRSPRTTSRPGMRRRSPPRSTKARGLARSRRASSTRSVRCCCTTDSPMVTSTNSPSSSASCISPSSR